MSSITSLLSPCLTLTISSLLGIYLPSLFPPLLPYIPTIRPFSTGVILSISICHLLPDGLAGARKIIKPSFLGELPLGEAALVAGFAAMTVLEALLPCPHSKVGEGAGGSDAPPCGGGEGEGVGVGVGVGKVCIEQGRIRGLSCDSEKGALSQGQVEPPCESTVLLGGGEGRMEGGIEDSNNGAENSKLQILELSIALHSVLIGLPVTKSPSGSLVTALGIHQFFEGVSLGLAGLSAGLNNKEFAKLAAVFSLSISVGVSLGYSSSSLPIASVGPSAWEGLGNCVASGVLLFVAVEFYVKDFAEAKHHGRKWGKITSFLTGCVVMTALAIWT
jgi:zinc transporter ZupT